ncbi:triose-phosphate isomerase [uncultured Roseovarius sp.]|uniref:triose-phosphate isomerase n=1 Tax=uncultured Roseovarius sp. TaxID=293344 RepID=UPI0026031DD0|nr:triose-phosphate isomerase [uncultured Roseovarius sp.]
MSRRKLAAGNWKMNGTRAALSELQALVSAHPDPSVDILICPPSTLLRDAAALADTAPLDIGGQDCHSEATGAHTGDISAPMLTDAGATHVILGHSERRENHNESSELVRAKARAAHAAGLTAIICLGESLSEREAANTLDIIAGQLSSSVPDATTAVNTVIAYEPIWAIGTGLTPTVAQIDEVHDFIRTRLITRFGPDIGNGVRLLYGGSVKPSNAAEIFETDNVDGALVGGASLKQSDFSPIIKALEESA